MSAAETSTDDPPLSSGQLARAAGVNLQTLRFYERRGLLDQPARSLGGHRRYPAHTVTVLRLIKATQALGFSLAEISILLDAARHRHPPGGADGLRQRATDKLREVESRIAELHDVAQNLREAVDAGCDDLLRCAASSECPLPLG